MIRLEIIVSFQFITSAFNADQKESDKSDAVPIGDDFYNYDDDLDDAVDDDDNVTY